MCSSNRNGSDGIIQIVSCKESSGNWIGDSSNETMFLLNELFQAYPLDSVELLDNQGTEDTVQKVVKKTGQRQQILLPLHLLHQPELALLASVGLDRSLHEMT